MSTCHFDKNSLPLGRVPQRGMELLRIQETTDSQATKADVTRSVHWVWLYSRESPSRHAPSILTFTSYVNSSNLCCWNHEPSWNSKTGKHNNSKTGKHNNSCKKGHLRKSTHKIKRGKKLCMTKNAKHTFWILLQWKSTSSTPSIDKPCFSTT